MNLRLEDEAGQELWTGTLAEMLDANPDEAEDIQEWAETNIPELVFGGGASPITTLTRVS